VKTREQALTEQQRERLLAEAGALATSAPQEGEVMVYSAMHEFEPNMLPVSGGRSECRRCGLGPYDAVHDKRLVGRPWGTCRIVIEAVPPAAAYRWMGCVYRRRVYIAAGFGDTHDEAYADGVRAAEEKGASPRLSEAGAYFLADPDRDERIRHDIDESLRPAGRNK